jgi:alpha-galactosidase
MSLWALFSSPLLSSSDLRSIDESTKSILMNSDLLSIHRDPLAAQVKIVKKKNNVRVYKKDLIDGFSLVILNSGDIPISFDLNNISDLSSSEVKNIFDIWTKSILNKTQLEKISILPHQTIFLKVKTK